MRRLLMKINRELLLNNLNYVSKALSPNKTAPLIMRSIYIGIKENILELKATDTVISISCRIPFETKETFEALLPGDFLVPLFSQLTTTEVEIISKPDLQYEIRANGLYRVRGLDPKDYREPIKKDEESKSIGQVSLELIKTAFKKVAYTVADDLTRPNLCGIFLNGPLGEFVTSDGVRVSIFSTGSKIIPTTVFFTADVAKIFESIPTGPEMVELEGASNLVIFKVKNFVITSRLLAAPFPDYLQIVKIIEEQNQGVVEFNRKEMGAALKRCSIFREGDSAQFLTLFSKDSIKIKVGKDNVGREVVKAVSKEIKEEKIVLGMNLDYLMKCFDIMGADTVTAEINLKKPAAVRFKEVLPNGTYSCIVAPYIVPTSEKANE
jgi:DNA polymerase III sliding clamp (beta) subunit (PCNA family)